jgi:hypothetical protein
MPVLVDRIALRPLTLLFVIGYVMKQERTKTMVMAVLTDIQFWIPAVVLALGVALLVFIHGN